MSVSTKPLPGTTKDPLYPDSDGEPMGETDFHIAALILLRETLKLYFRARPDVYVAADMFLYYERGNPKACKSPDVMVTKGVGKHLRRSFRTWEEETVPCVIFEITSRKTRQEDQVDKPAVYARLGVAEYFLFDPEADYLEPPLQGFRLENGKYVPLVADAEGCLTSAELDLRLSAEGYMLRLIDAQTGEPVLTQEERVEQERQRAKEERQRAKEERQRAKQEKQRAEKERQHAEKAKQRAEKEKRRAEKEKRRADDLEAEVARLRAALARRKEKQE
jgi:Uma2 family endonuclease